MSDMLGVERALRKFIVNYTKIIQYQLNYICYKLSSSMWRELYISDAI